MSHDYGFISSEEEDAIGEEEARSRSDDDLRHFITTGNANVYEKTEAKRRGIA